MEEKQNKKVIALTAVVTAVITAVIILAVFASVVYLKYGNLIEFNKNYSKLVELTDIIDKNYIGTYDPSTVAEEASYAIVDGIGDQWSYYLSAEEVAEQELFVNNNYVGIGVTITKAENEYINVELVSPESGAQAAGIMPQDKIIAVEGTDILNMTTDEVKAMISGVAGTFVNLTIQRGEEKMDLSVERTIIKINSISYEMIGNTGYVAISNFFKNTGDDFIAAVDDLISQGADSLVFDVRFNGGGYRHELLKMLDYLLPEGVIFNSEDINGNTAAKVSDAECIELPMTVLVNDMTFSAAEYFAEAIREFGWGSVVGSNTSGKGYSQILIMLSDGSAVNLSTMKYFTPNGTCLAGVGITPDVVIETDDEEYYGVYYGVIDNSEDSQLTAALELVKSK